MISLLRDLLADSTEIKVLSQNIRKEAQEAVASVKRNGYILDDLCQELDLDRHKSGLGIGCPHAK